MRDRFLRQASRESTPAQRASVLIPAGILFLFILPIAILRRGGRLDRALGWVAPPPGPASSITGGLMVLGGWALGVWSNYVQFTLGRGTPVPIVATQKLIAKAPYAYCRNPMALGAIVAYFGISLLARSRGAALIVSGFSAALLAYIKLVEEREMVARFGEEYLAYCSRVPFIIPRLPRRE